LGQIIRGIIPERAQLLQDAIAKQYRVSRIPAAKQNGGAYLSGE
jgi:hypothetical protein